MGVLTVSSLLASLVYLALAVYAIQRRAESPVTRPFLLLCLGFGVSSVLMTLVGQAATAESAEFWFRAATPFSTFVPAVSLHVLLTMAGRLRRGQPWRTALIYLPTLPTIYQELLGPPSTRVTLVESPDGWLLDFGGPARPFMIYFAIWSALYVAYGYFRLWQWGRAAPTRREHHQARVMLWSGLASFLSLAVGHAASAHLLGGRMPPSLPVPGLIVSIGFALAIFRHRLLVVTPSLAVEQILASLQDMLFILDDRGRVLEANGVARAALAPTGVPIVGRRLADFADEPGPLATVLDAMKDAAPPGPRIEVHLVVGSERLPVEVSGSAIRDDDGDRVALAVMARDLRDTQRLRHEIDERRQAEECLAATLRSVADGIVAADVTGRVVLMNPVAERLTGCPESGAAGRPLAEVVRLRDARTGAPVTDLLAAASRPASGPIADFLLGADDETRRQATCVATPMRDASGRDAGFVLVLRDVTAERQVEEELLKTSRLESIGLLAGGIAHDFNNILTAMLGYVELAAWDLPESSEPRRKLAGAEAAGRRARELTTKLLTFSRGGTPALRRTDVAGVIAESVSLVAGWQSARCEVEIDPEAWPALADESQLSQALNNLLLNALQAMPGGGKVTVTARNVAAAEPFDEAGVTIPAGRWVRISVGDQGVGIAREHLHRVFDPFFTTRADGTGLGLSTTYSIVRKHAGRITLESEVGRGTTVCLYLQAAEEGAASAAASAPTATTQAVRGRRILVMDDHSAVLDVVREMLKAIGCEAHLCTDGAEAVRAYQDAMAGGARFDAVILDCIVPGGMGGAQAAREIFALDPGARLIISSGYVNEPILAHYRAHGFAGALGKPYLPEALGRALEAAIGGA